MTSVDVEEEMIPRNYQCKLMEIAVRQNSIIFLPTGTGKTFIGTMVLKQLSRPLNKPVNEGGKISCMLVNTVALVEQQSRHLRLHTPFKVGAYSGEMNLDDWSETIWKREINNHQVFVMTAQILLNIVDASILSLNDVNLLIFDECHRAVSDHCMRQIMMHFQNLSEPPRVLGLTATLLNSNCKPGQVFENVRALETTFHSKIATVEELQVVLGYRTNPKELVKSFTKHVSNTSDNRAIHYLKDIINHLSMIKIEESMPSPAKLNLERLDHQKGLKDIFNLIKDAIYHIETMGTFGGHVAILSHMIQIERLKKSSQTKQMTLVMDTILTTFTIVHKILADKMKNCDDSLKVKKFSSSQVMVLLGTLLEYKRKSQLALCGIVFVQRRFTAKILYHILAHLAEHDQEFVELKPNFMVGFNVNPFNDTRESLYRSKLNKKVLLQFENKEVNLIVASNVLEEGIDIPMCTLVSRYDKPVDYRAYIQSKGRARHRSSFYYMIVDSEEIDKFREIYTTFQTVENELNELFIGRNESRLAPTQDEIQELYDEHVLPPYYSQGPGSAQVTMISAISLLCRYCITLPADHYTSYNPNWYVDKVGPGGESNFIQNANETAFLYKVIIELPIICPIREPIESDYFTNKKTAKRAAALKACELLHKAGELDDTLLPKRHTIVDEDIDFLFEHWPAIRNKMDGNSKSLKNYAKKVPAVLNLQIQPDAPVYLHILELTPLFTYDNPTSKMIHEIYSSPTCFAVLTANPLPNLCEFSVYVSAGEINVNVSVNKIGLVLTAEELAEVKEFHCLVFRDLLKILKQFLVMDNKDEVEGMLVVPVLKTEGSIDFDILRNYKELFDQKKEPKEQEKANLVVTEESYLGKIVTPWYRPDDTIYVVTAVCTDLNASSPFPSDDFDTYLDYFNDKYHIRVLKPLQPLLLVKALSKRLNCLKPRGLSNKRNKDKLYEDMEEHLIPELCVKQDFPGYLWILSRLLPSVLHRLFSLLQADELRQMIASDLGLGNSSKAKRLELDPHLAVDTSEGSPLKSKKRQRNVNEEEGDVPVALPQTELLTLVQDFNTKRIEQDYPWTEKDEPVDIERNLNVTVMDIQYYESFITQRVSLHQRIAKNYKANKSLAAITYHTEFTPKVTLQLLEAKSAKLSPDLADVLKSVTTAKANDVVNLERLETLGDSFLKVSISLYILLRFPQYEEGRATALKGRIISNRNLFYAALARQLTGYVKNSDFTPTFEWKPPYFCVPEIVLDKINDKRMSASSLFAFLFSNKEQSTGTLTAQKQQEIDEYNEAAEDGDKQENVYDSVLAFFDLLKIPDKSVADSVEGLLGVYFESGGFETALKLLSWLHIIPHTENIENLLRRPIPNPILNPNATQTNIDYFLSSRTEIERRLGYTFKNPAYLLQALTHSTFTANRITSCYQKLEFLGDAVLDFLITCYIYETCESLSPGDLTDLRSALVNNITFAGFTVRCGFHQFLMYANGHLQDLIENFVQFQEKNGYAINDEVLILLQEDDLHLAEHVDVPKVLGDIFEALAGAIFLDSGMQLETVWNVFYAIMWKEIETFKTKVPKNSIRLIYETIGAHPQFLPGVPVENGGTMVPLDFMLDGVKKRVYGFGDNKSVAKRAAAKIALRLMHK